MLPAVTGATQARPRASAATEKQNTSQEIRRLTSQHGTEDKERRESDTATCVADDEAREELVTGQDLTCAVSSTLPTVPREVTVRWTVPAGDRPGRDSPKSVSIRRKLITQKERGYGHRTLLQNTLSLLTFPRCLTRCPCGGN